MKGKIEMREFSVIEEYVLMTMDNKEVKKNMYFKVNEALDITIGIFFELIMKELIKLDEKNNIIIASDNEPDTQYLKLQYNIIKKSSPKTLKQWIQNSTVDYTWLKNKEIIDCIVELFMKEGHVCRKKIDGIFIGEKFLYKVKRETLDFLVQRMRAEILEVGDIDEETKLLILLLDLSERINYYFSEYESEVLRERLNEIKESKLGREISGLQKAKYRMSETGAVVILND